MNINRPAVSAQRKARTMQKAYQAETAIPLNRTCKNMKKIIISITVFLTAFLGAYGDTYFGTFTETITETNDPLYHVGQTFNGSYWYDSATADGTFHTPTWGTPQPGVNYTLDGTVYTPFAAEVDFDYMGVQYHLTGPGGAQRELRNTVNHGQLVVTNGQVADFEWSYEQGGFYMYMKNSDFVALSFYDKGPADQVPTTRGTVSFGEPSRVPEATTTWALVAASVLGLGFIRRFVC
jgi:hypothetical protein